MSINFGSVNLLEACGCLQTCNEVAVTYQFSAAYTKQFCCFLKCSNYSFTPEAFSLGLRRPGHEAGHSPASSGDGKNEWNYPYMLLHMPSWLVEAQRLVAWLPSTSLLR